MLHSNEAEVQPQPGTTPDVSPALQRLDNFVSFYNSLSAQDLSVLAQLYHPEVRFIDPVHQIDGLDALQQYFGHAYDRLDSCTFAAHAMAGQQLQGFVSWQMQFSHQAIASGALIKVDGCTELHWHQDGRIIYHRDYYDLTQMVYQHVPVVAWLTGKIKQKMAQA
jgi:hypothetical protein